MHGPLNVKHFPLFVTITQSFSPFPCYK